jgi:hypothetical protein
MRSAWLAAVGVVLLAGSASAFHEGELPLVQRLALDLEARARHVAGLATSQSHHFSHREHRMLEHLDRFAAAANRFHAVVAGYFASPGQTLAELDLINREADGVERYVYSSHAVSHVVGEWDNLCEVIRQLNAIVGYRRGAAYSPYGTGYVPYRSRSAHGYSPYGRGYRRDDDDDDHRRRGIWRR